MISEVEQFLKRYIKFKNIMIVYPYIVIFSIIATTLTMFGYGLTNSSVYMSLVVIILCLIYPVIKSTYNVTKQTALSMLELKNIIKIDNEIVTVYERDYLIELAKNDQLIDLSTNEEDSIMMTILNKNTPALKLMQKNPNLDKITISKNTVRYLTFDLKYQHIINELGRSIPIKEIKYELKSKGTAKKVKNTDILKDKLRKNP